MIPLLLTFNLLCGIDAGLTHYGITQREMREGWLPTQSPWVIDGMIAGSAMSVDVAALKLRKNHPKLALGLVIGVTIVRGWVVVHNIHELTR